MHVASSPDPLLALVLGVAAVGAVLLVLLGLAALVRRQSVSYLLVALAFAMLLGRTAAAALTMSGLLPDADHHLLEHVLDVAMALLVLTAVYYARRVQTTTGGNA